MIKRFFLLLVFSMFVFINLSYAETPFTDKPVKDASQQKDNKLPVSAPPLPGSSVSIPIPGQVDGILPFKEKLVVKGKVNNKVVVVNSQGEQLTVNDGEIVSGCLIKYPEVICDPQKISRINLDKKNKELEKQLSLKNQEIEKLKKEVERFMKERESLKKEVDKLKKENLELQEKAKALSKEKEVVEKNVERLKTEQSVLENKLKAIEKERNDLDSQLKDLKKEIFALREVNKSIADKEAIIASLKKEISSCTTQLSFYREGSFLSNCKFVTKNIGSFLICPTNEGVQIISSVDIIRNLENVLKKINKEYVSSYKEEVGMLFLSDEQI